MRSGLQVSEYDSYDYELSKNGISEERTDGAYILVKDSQPQPDPCKLMMKSIKHAVLIFFKDWFKSTNLVVSLATSKSKLLQVMTCEEKARESSVCPKQGVCHPRFVLEIEHFLWKWSSLLTNDDYAQLLWSLGGAWKGQSMWVASILECRWWPGSRSRRKDKSKVRRGDFHARRLSTQFNETPNSSCSTRMQAQVGPKSCISILTNVFKLKRRLQRPSSKSESHKCLNYQKTFWRRQKILLY